ncbi:glycosyltransferase [Sphingomonas montanisoli]|uniref:Mannosyltransferase n=1 Tax=Sphingomonas montanisoli TaxID=2606412 RepID=A0A5D9BYU6_9SPHN|nr:glycosyltransferase [Sphingomonas montanisoli]TZG24609.1 mannosyltransferase [Sphingomonas montanisoli]
MIPKLIHFIWVGNEAKRPDNCMESWHALNPDWEFRLWGNAELNGLDWINAKHMTAMYDRELNGVADMMRWEILHAHGGIVVDADSIALRPLDDHLLDCEAFACWENEIVRPGLIAAGYFGSVAGNPFVKQIIDDIAAEPSVTHDTAWKTVGPLRLTESYRIYGYSKLRIYPSHYFIPKHFSGVAYDGSDPVYAHQLWGSTRASYDEIRQVDVDAVQGDFGVVEAIAPIAPEPVAAPAPAPMAAAPQVTGSRLETIHDPYFVQKVEISTEIATVNRLELFLNICRGKRVLHVGCADWPITDPATSLHLALEAVCAQLDGVDPHVEALAQLEPYVSGRLFGSLDDVTDSYDVVLVPEVLEHVPNVDDFLKSLERVDASTFFISVPDAFQCRGGHFDYIDGAQTFVEVVHPDHNVWYTPYTFANTIRKYSDLQIEQMWFFNRISILALLSKPALAMAA